jgi:hypothetical protein
MTTKRFYGKDPWSPVLKRKIIGIFKNVLVRPGEW